MRAAHWIIALSALAGLLLMRIMPNDIYFCDSSVFCMFQNCLLRECPGIFIVILEALRTVICLFQSIAAVESKAAAVFGFITAVETLNMFWKHNGSKSFAFQECSVSKYIQGVWKIHFCQV